METGSEANAPATDAHVKPIPVTVTDWDFRQDPPVKHERTKYLLFNMWSYRRACEAMGFDIDKMQDAANRMQKGGEEAEDAEHVNHAEQVKDLLQVDVSDLKAMRVLFWGALLVQNPNLTQEQAEQWMTVHNFEKIAVKVVRAVSMFVNGRDIQDTDRAEQIVRDAKQNPEASGKETPGDE